MWREIIVIREQEVSRITSFRNIEKILKITSQFQVVKNCKISKKKIEISKILIRPPKNVQIDAPCSNENSTISEGSLVLLSRTLHDIVIGVKKLNNKTKIFFFLPI